MARTFTQRTVLTGSITQADDLNFEVNGALAEFNGRLDQHNMPLLSVVSASLTANVLVNEQPTVGSQGVFNAHYYAGPYTTAFTVDGDDGDVGVGWNDMPTTCSVSFQAKEGMLKGAAVFTAERYPPIYITGGTTTELDMSTYWWEAGVFVNNNLVGQSGRIYGRKFTVDLPFGCPIGNEDAQVDVRWQSPLGGGYRSELTGSVYRTPLAISGSFVWVRNAYR